MVTYEEFKQEYLDDIHLEAQIEGTTYDDYFFNDVLGKLISMGELTDPQPLCINKKGRHNRIMSFDAIAFDESDKSVVLITNDFKDSLTEVISRTDINTFTTRMLNFLEEAYESQLEKYFDKYDDALRIGNDISRRMHIDYVNPEGDESLDKIKLFIITNRNLSEAIKSLPSTTFIGKKVEINVWSIYRLYELYLSGRDKEPIIIDVRKYNIEGIPCIKAAMTENLDYDAYLAIVPGEFLHKIYYDHGSRLLEGNVRAFLSNRGKINRGIRKTIKDEPTKFFTYNNGIACTASQVKLSEDEHFILEMEDLQIINGGQTTASLTSAVLRDKFSLENIFVPMKLTVVKNDDYDNMIQNISRYANSQNKVTEADLFSNHPFHRAFEALAKKIQAPAKTNELNNTFWYYERSRGKYEQEQFKFTKKSERDNFLKKYPKNQVIKKEELAKYFVAAHLLRPDRVSAGSQKAMRYFAEYVDDKYTKNPEYFNNEQFYKLCICYTILYRSTDRIVNHASWYNVGGYKLNIVPYTVSKLISLIPSGYSIDYDRIWKKQELYPSLRAEVDKLAEITNEFIQQSSGIIVTEYCKKEETWKRYKTVSYQLSNEFIKDLISKELMQEKMDTQIKSEKLTNVLNVESEIIRLGGAYWRRLIAEGTKRSILSPMELDLLGIAASSDTNRPKIATPKQAKLIWKIREKLENHGVIVD